MDVLSVTDAGVRRCAPDDVPGLLNDGAGGFVWVDVPEPDEATSRFLGDTFGFHPLALRDCQRRSHLPKVYGYPDHVFVVLHAPERGEAGHVHLLELDQFIGERYLVTVHGPLGAGVPVEAALRETRAVMDRIEDGRSRSTSPAQLSHAIVSRMARRMEAHVSSLATEIASLERRVMSGDAKDPEAALEEMFRVRHELLTLRTMAAQSREAYARMASLTRRVPPPAAPLIEDTLEQFDRLRGLCDQEKEFLQGVVDFYQSRTATKMNIAMERLALIAAVLMPITAVAGIYGMNIIVNDSSKPLHIAGVLLVMAVVTALMLRWAKRQGWW